MILRRTEHPRLVWIVDHLIMVYIAGAVTILVVLAILEAIRK